MSSADDSSQLGSSGNSSGSGPSRLVDDLCWLVDIPSVTGEERALRDAIAERLSATVEVDIVGESLVAGRRTGRPRIDLYGHLDTVPENGNLSARIEDGRVKAAAGWISRGLRVDRHDEELRRLRVRLWWIRLMGAIVRVFR